MTRTEIIAVREEANANLKAYAVSAKDFDNVTDVRMSFEILAQLALSNMLLLDLLYLLTPPEIHPESGAVN